MAYDIDRRLVLRLLAASAFSDLAVADVIGAEEQILELDSTGLIARIRDGSLRAEQVCSTFLRQYERQRSLNVVTWIDQAKVLSCARDVDRARDRGDRLPPLAGLPILVKDNIDTVGFPTSAGTAFLRRNFPRRNAEVVERLLQQGAIVMGKANMDELASWITSSNPTFGFVRNPYNPELIPGGSSGGSAAAIAARIVPAALGTDTGGSVRVPSAFCGVVGFRPSIYPRRLYSAEGVLPHTPDLDTIGPMGRSVADVAMLHAAIVGQLTVHPRPLETARIGVPRLPYWGDLAPEVETVARAALTSLRDRGATLVEVDLREVDEAVSKIPVEPFVDELEKIRRTQIPSVSLHELTEQITNCSLRAELKKFELGLEAGRDATLVTNGVAHRDAVRAAYCAVFRRHDIQAIVMPTVVLPPPKIGVACDEEKLIELNGRMVPEWIVLRNTITEPKLGLPSLSLPAGLDKNGLPVGLEFDGLPGDDSALLALGMAAEAAIGRVPPPRHTLSRI